MASPKRFVVISVGCLECNQGEANPEIELQTDDITEARAQAAKHWLPSDGDAFILDTLERTLEPAAKPAS